MSKVLTAFGGLEIDEMPAEANTPRRILRAKFVQLLKRIAFARDKKSQKVTQ